ncbi:MAG: DUF2281 domain-containing protein [Methanosarcinales archaeon]
MASRVLDESEKTIISLFKSLSEERKQEVIDFAEFLIQKEDKEDYDFLDLNESIINAFKDIKEGRIRPARELLNEL